MGILHRTLGIYTTGVIRKNENNSLGYIIVARENLIKGETHEKLTK